jgi:hypothetical protein
MYMFVCAFLTFVLFISDFLNKHEKICLYRCIPISISSCIYIYMFAYLYVYLCVRFKHDYIYTDRKDVYTLTGKMHIYIYTRTYTHKYMHTYIHTHMHTYIHTCMHAYMHTYIHTHIHTHTHVLVYIISVFLFVCACTHLHT